MTLEEEYRLSCYEELTTLGNHNHIYLVKHKLSGEIFVKKVLSRFSLDVYKQLRDLQISGIPKIHDLILENNPDRRLYSWTNFGTAACGTDNTGLFGCSCDHA